MFAYNISIRFDFRHTGHQVIEHERQKIHDLKKKSHDEARTQYLRSTQQTTEKATELTASPQQTPPTKLPHAPLNAKWVWVSV